MAIIDRIKFDGLASREWLIYKHPAENLVFGTQLIVGEGQAAIFVKSGEICDCFTAGTHTLDAKNLPILQGILNLPFGGKTPFTAEVFFLNTTTKLDIHWGTSDPIQLIDPKYFTRLHIRAFGQMGMKLQDYPTFLRELIGVMQPKEFVVFDKLRSFYKGLIVQKIKVIISDIIINDKISALEITPKMDEISAEVQAKIETEFAKYGFDVANFFIESINFPDEDFDAINEVLKKRAEFEIMGDNRYVTARTFDVYDSAAGNQNGVAGAFAAGGMGIGIGASVAQSMPGMMPGVMNPNPMGVGAGVAMGAGAGVANPTVTCPQCQAKNPQGGKFCLECGANIAPKPPVEEKIPCPKCGTMLPKEAKFCFGCGEKITVPAVQTPKECPKCGEDLPPNAKFCLNCGEEIK